MNSLQFFILRRIFIQQRKGKKMKKLQGVWKYVGILVMAGTLIGCSNKYNMGSSESSAKILNSYVKKDAPEGWFYNFGIGPNYSLALKDATNSLSFRKPLSVETKVVTSMTGFRDKNGYRQIEPEKNVESTPLENAIATLSSSFMYSFKSANLLCNSSCMI